jgi:xylan 1,4-beta-xylosidase
MMRSRADLGPRRIPLVILAALWLLPASCAAGPPASRRNPTIDDASAGERVEIRVRASERIGSIRSYLGVNAGPAPLLPQLPDVGRQYREIGVDIVRTHDFFGPADIDARWPKPDALARKARASGANAIFLDWDADPSKASSYNFAPTDRVLKAIVDSGAEIYFRIGRSWAADPSPPPDFDKYTEVVRHVAMHYNQGWADGYRFDIRYWEFWNEPDLEAAWMPGFARPFWSGTPREFYSLYEKVARALKDLDPQLQVGTCAKAAAPRSGPYREGLIDFVASKRVPIDFYSWHHYHAKTHDPHEIVEIGDDIRRLLDRAGLRSTESHVTEWNEEFNALPAKDASTADMRRAAFLASVLVYLQDSSLDRAFFYRGDATALGLFDLEGRPRKQALAFKAVGSMRDTPERLAATGGDTQGLTVLAGRSPDGKTVQILLSHYAAPEKARRRALRWRDRARRNAAKAGTASDFTLSVDDLPWAKSAFRVRFYHLSADRDLELAGEETGEGRTFRTTITLPPSTLQLVRIEQMGSASRRRSVP